MQIPISRGWLCKIVAMAMLVTACIACSAIAPRAWADDGSLVKYRQVEGTVYFTRSLDGKFAVSNGETPGLVMANLPVDLSEVCQVDLDKHDLGDYNCPAPAGAGCMYECTALQLFVYVAEHYANDADIEVTGGASHAYIERFWGEDENMLYYVNGLYPLESAGWGATCDTIALSDGDVITNAHYTDWGFYSDPETGFHFFLKPGCVYERRGKYAPPIINGAQIEHTCKAVAGVPFEVRLARATGNVSAGEETSYIGEQYWNVYWDDEYDLDENSLYAAGFVSTDADGKAIIEFAEPGTYWVWADGGFGAFGGECENSYVSSPAALRVEVVDSASVDQVIWDLRDSIMGLPSPDEIAGISPDDSDAIQALLKDVGSIQGDYEALDVESQSFVGADAQAKLLAVAQALDALVESAEPFASALKGAESALCAYDKAWELADGAMQAALQAMRSAEAAVAYPGDAAVSAADAAVDAVRDALALVQEAANAADVATEAVSRVRDEAVSDSSDQVVASLVERASSAREQAYEAVSAMLSLRDEASSVAKQARAAAELAKTAEAKANPMKAKAKIVKVKAKKLKKKGRNVQAVAVTGAQGAVTYKLVKVKAKKKLLKQAKKKIKLAAGGKLKLGKKLKKGTYKVTVRVSVAGNASYKPATQDVVVKLKVK